MFNVWLPEGGQGGPRPSNALGVTGAGGPTARAARLCVCTCVIRSSRQWSELRLLLFGGRGASCPPGVCRLPQKHVHSCLPHGWVAALCWELEETKTDYFSWTAASLQPTPQSPNSPIRQILPCGHCPVGRDSWCSLLCPLPRSLCLNSHFSPLFCSAISLLSH